MPTTGELIDVTPADRPVLVELLDAHLRELKCPGEYRYLDAYFTKPGRYASFISSGSRIAGFALVRGPESTDHRWQIAEFYVTPAKRRCGVGRAAVLAIWRRFPGDWELELAAGDERARSFWLACAHAATGHAPTMTEVIASSGKRLQLELTIAPDAWRAAPRTLK